jgi:uncharacterized protein YggE
MPKKTLFLFITLSMLGGALCAAPPKSEPDADSNRVISINSFAKVKVKPDACVLFLEMRSTSPLAADALQQNVKKMGEILAKVKDLGIKDEEVKLSGNLFTPPGGGRYYMPAGQRPTGFDVDNSLQIWLRNFDPANLEELGKKLATILDELGKIGVSAQSPDFSRMSLGGSSVAAFTIQNPEPAEKQAFDQAIDKAKPIAEELAKKMGVKIVGIHSIQAMTPRMPERPMGSETDLVYTSSSPDELYVKTSLTVNFGYK